MLILTVVVNRIIKKASVFVLLFVSLICLCSCDGGGSKIDLYGNYDEITRTCKLTMNYTDTSSFLTDGIGPATLSSCTDGDTTNFTLPAGQYITIRYYGIDTPESTGQVQKWGKAASQFVKEKVTNAESIVLEATSTPASHDSYGTRYLGYVWYKEKGETEFKLLNLELVENGYTENKSINTSAYKYYSYFKKASDFATENGLRVHGDYEDPLYSTAAEKITIKEFLDNKELYYNAEVDSGAKVRIQAFITGLKTSSTGTYTFIASQIIDGVQYNINIYAGYSSSPASQNMYIGNLYSITGNIAYHNGEYQISGVTYVAMQTGGDYLSQLQKNYYCTFDSSKEFSSAMGTSLFKDVTITSATVDGTVLTIVGTTAQNSMNGYKEDETYTFKVTVSDGFDATGLVGKSFSTTGIQEVKNSKEISVSDYNKIIFR